MENRTMLRTTRRITGCKEVTNLSPMKRNKLMSALMAAFSRFYFAAFVMLCLSPMAWAQFPVINNTTSTPIPGSGHNYIQMLSETVDPANGSVSLRINIPMPPGRQLSLPFSIDYNSNGIYSFENKWDQRQFSFNDLYDTSLYAAGWSYSLPHLSLIAVQIPQLSCVYFTGFAFTDSNGTRHPLGLLDPCQGSSIDSSGDDEIQAAFTGHDNTGAVVAAGDGTVYNFASIGDGLPRFVEDRNGNRITFTGDRFDCNNQGIGTCGIFTETDTLGRTVLSSSGFGHTGDTLSVSGLSDPYTLIWDAVARPGSLPLNYVYRGGPGDKPPDGKPGDCNGGGQQALGGNHYPVDGISAITLPNGQQFQFSYNDVGLLSKITYPDGGFVTYTWNANPLAEAAFLPGVPILDFFGNIDVPDCKYLYDTYAVDTRQVSFDGVTIAQTQHFTYTTTWPVTPGTVAWESKQTTVTTRDTANRTRFTTTYTYTPVFEVFPPRMFGTWVPPQIPLEQSIVYQGFDGNVLRTVNKSWFSKFELASETTTLDNGLTSQVTYKYGPGAQVTEKDEYDFGQGAPGPLLRKTITSYAAFPDNPLFPAPVILDRPAVSTVYDNNNKQVGQTVYCYDQTTPATTSAVAQHDYNHYGSIYNVRGNLTQELKWLNPPGGQNPNPSCGQSTSSSALSTTSTYDDTGQKLSTTDPMGFKTDYSYGFQNAYLTQVQTPIPNSTNPPHGTSQRLSTSADYDFNSGLLKSTTDVNQKTTTYSYNDPLNRVTQITRPDQSKTTIQYNDTPPDVFTYVVQDMDSSRTLQSYSYFDGVGHTIRTLQFDGTPTTPWIATETFYDGLGRSASVSNPHRVDQPSATPTLCSSVPCTTTLYDALGRVTTVTAADGQSVTYSYQGNRTSVTDPALLTKDLFHDALGRLTQVTENPTNVNGDGSPVTTYSFDALNNLVQITQDSQKRYFAYDSLGRRIRDFNPELGVNTNLNLADPLTGNSQWSEAFSYNNNSNPESFTSASGIVTTNSYDAVNRIITTQYSDGTPQIDKFYDGTGSASLSNGLGRPSLVTSSVAQFSYDGYDSIGNVLGTTQTVDGLHYQITYQYDLAGHLISERYPSQRIVRTGYDAAGRVASLDSPSNTTSYVDQVQYAPHGAITSLLLGNGFWETRAYDQNRLQPTKIDVGTAKGGNDRLSLQYDYHDANGKNSGNVQRQWITAPFAMTPGSFAVTELAMYDGLNRLNKIQEIPGSNVQFPFQATAIWEQDFMLDRWGNRTKLTSTGVVPLSNHAPPIDQNTNRFVATGGFGYDGAGNLATEPVDAGSNSYTYDANNHLIQSPTNAGTASYSYDGLGHRVKKTVNGQTTIFGYDVLGRLVAEYNPAVTPTNGTRYMTQDILGSTRLLTGTDPNTLNPVVVTRYDYLPYGEIIPSGLGGRNQVGGYGPEGPVHQLFTGKEKDTETNLDYFLARYSSNEKGRFTSPDPPFAGWHFEDPQSLNLYGYVGNNPLGRADLDGHEGQEGQCPGQDCPRRRARRAGQDVEVSPAYSKPIDVQNPADHLNHLLDRAYDPIQIGNDIRTLFRDDIGGMIHDFWGDATAPDGSQTVGRGLFSVTHFNDGGFQVLVGPSKSWPDWVGFSSSRGETPQTGLALVGAAGFGRGLQGTLSLGNEGPKFDLTPIEGNPQGGLQVGFTYRPKDFTISEALPAILWGIVQQGTGQYLPWFEGSDHRSIIAVPTKMPGVP